jgi:hypothetical protein
MPSPHEFTESKGFTAPLFFDDSLSSSVATEKEATGLAKGELSSRTLFRGLLLTLAAYACLSLVFYLFPRAGISILGSLPWVGFLVLEDHRLHQRVVLDPLSAAFETLNDNKTVLVISGIATNKNALSLREIEIEGKIYDSQGRELGHEIISGGNALSRKVLRDLTAKDISVLQVQKARQQFAIPAKESTEFVIVFLNPNLNATKFNARVISARAVA